MFKRVLFVAFVNKGKCVGCGECEKICPVGAIRVIEGKAKVNYWIIPMCLGCGVCVYYCPKQAICPIPRRCILPTTLRL